MKTLEDVIREVDKVGDVEYEGGMDHVFNVVTDIYDGIGNGDRWRILDYLVMHWQYGKSFDEQEEHYRRFVDYLVNEVKETGEMVKPTKSR